MQNPDWSRESMKTILAWGWVSPTGQDHVGRRKDGTHDRMAYDLGLGTWVQAVKAGWVRYILFSDGHMGLTLIINPGTLSAARKLVDRPEVATVSFEWIVDGRIQQSGVLSAKEAVMAIRAKGRVQNPMWGAAAFTGGRVQDPLEWGWVTAAGRVIKGKPMGYHDALARSAGLGKDWLDAVAKGNVKYEITPKGVLVVEGLREPQQIKLIIKLAERPEVREVRVSWIRGEDGVTMSYDGNDVDVMLQRMRALLRERNPLTLTPTHQRQARGNKFNILVEMTPMEFLRLTTVDDAQIAEIIDTAKPLSTYNAAAAAETNIIPCFLTLDIASGKAKVTGHEGRHRAGALLNAGEDGVGQPVYLRIQDAHPGQAEKMLEKLPGGRKAWMWDTTYLWGWDELPEMLVGQFRATVKVPKSRLKVIEPYVQERAKKARGL